jgi:hypothetical protein
MSKKLLEEIFRFQQIAGLTPVGNLVREAEEEEEEMEDEKPEVRKDAPDASLDVADPEDLEKNVSKADIAAADKDMSKISNDVEKLRHLQGQKDAFIKMFKSGAMDIEQYKKMIGNIPQEIKRLEAKLNKDLTMGDDEDLTEATGLAGMLGIDVGDLTNEKMEELLTTIMQHFYTNAKELQNMNARGIANDIRAALTKLKSRTGN